MSNGNTAGRYLLVPMSVEALMVGAPAGQWTDLHPDFSWLYGGRILGTQVAPVLFKPKPEDGAPQGGSGVRREWWSQPGIHLHWALPEALTRGQQKRPANSQEPLPAPEFPLIPNRWLVQRLVRKPDASNELSVRAWVVESDYLYNPDNKKGKLKEEDAVTFPRLDAYALYDYVGKKFDYTSWTEKQQAYRIPLTALGYGDPAFAAYYPACKSLFGFYDPLSDVASDTTLAYWVAGWYSDPAQDILCHFSMDELKWVCSSTPQSPPTQILCHGAIFNIRWKDHKFTYASSVPHGAEKDFRVALGNTTTEALAAFLAQKLDTPKLEPLLEAFQEDQLGRDSDLLELEFTLHQQRFGSLGGGREFAIQKKPAGAGQAPTASDATLPESLEKLLAELNRMERDFERRQREWDGHRWELYAMWQKWASQYSKSAKKPTELTGKLNERVKDLTQLVETKAHELGDLKGQWDAAESAIRNMVEQQFADLELVASPSAPFWLANDPAVVISAPGLVPSHGPWQGARYSKQNELPCRVAGQELSGFFVDIPNEQAGIRVGASDVFRISGNPFAGGGAVPKGITDALLFEVLLLDPANADAIAEHAYVQEQLRTRLGEDELIGDIKRLQRPAAPEQAEPAPLRRYEGILPSPIALHDWESNPWLPLFLEWRVAWYSSYTNPATALEHWKLGTEAPEFQWTGGTSELPAPQIYEGYTILTPHAIRQLEERLRKYNADKHDQDVAQIISQLNHMPLLGQSFGGLNNALIMRDQCLQIAPINPAIFAGKQENQRDPIIDLVKGVNPVSPASQLLTALFDPAKPGVDKPFLPIRAGHLKLLALSVVDAFGQTLQLHNLDRPARAESLRPERQDAEPLLQFSPRFAQPLRLRFDWSPTPNPPGTYPVNSPVCGWVIPNHLDKNLIIYDGHGTPFGALQKILRTSAAGGTGGTRPKDDKAFFWVSMPATEHKPESILNPHLRNFVEFLRNLDVGTGTAFWNLLDEALAKTDPGEPEDDPLLSLLLGRPLALVRAELGLELGGLPATDQGIETLGKFDSKGFTKIKFPLQLGAAQKDMDGLIGYFTDSPEAKSSGTFYPAAGAKGTAHAGSIEYEHTLAVDCETRPALTLLLDPRAKVHAVTGILPKASASLPPRVGSAAKSAKEAFFQVAPLVSLGGAVSMPKPSDDYGKWSWAYQPQVTLWKEVPSVGTTTDQAGFAPDPPALSEGWLKLLMNPLSILNFWAKEGMLCVQPKTNITLGWTLVGGETLSLSAIEAGQEPSEIKSWTSSPLPEECRVQVQMPTTYILVLQDKEGNRSEKRLSVALQGANGHG